MFHNKLLNYRRVNRKIIKLNGVHRDLSSFRLLISLWLYHGDPKYMVTISYCRVFFDGVTVNGGYNQGKMRTYSFLAITNRLNSWPIQICLTPAKLILVIYTTVAIVLCKTLWNYDRNGDFQTFCCKWTGVWMSIYGWHLMDPWILFFGKHMIIHEMEFLFFPTCSDNQQFAIWSVLSNLLVPNVFFQANQKIFVHVLSVHK